MKNSEALLLTLKQTLKKMGVTHSELASNLKVSEVTIKRMLNRQSPMSLERLGEICEYINLDFAELAQLVKTKRDMSVARLTVEQEKILAGDEALFLIFYLILMNYSVENIERDFKFTSAQIRNNLLLLEKIGVVELGEKNKIKLKIYRKVRWIKGGLLDKKYYSEMERDYLTGNFNEKNSFSTFMNHVLSPESQDIAIQKVKELAAEIERLSELELALNKNSSPSMTFMLKVTSWEPPFFKNYRRV